MRPITLLLCFTLAFAAGAPTVADSTDPAVIAARAERERKRRLERHAAVIGNEELAAATALPELGQIGALPLPASASSEPAAAPPAPPPLPAVLADDDYQDEAWWKERMKIAEARVAELELDLEYARKRLLIFRLGLVMPSEPLGDRNRKGEIDQQLRLVAEIERSLIAARLVPAAIRDEARRAGVLPGWLR